MEYVSSLFLPKSSPASGNHQSFAHSEPSNTLPVHVVVCTLDGGWIQVGSGLYCRVLICYRVHTVSRQLPSPRDPNANSSLILGKLEVCRGAKALWLDFEVEKLSFFPSDSCVPSASPHPSLAPLRTPIQTRASATANYDLKDMFPNKNTLSQQA